MTDLFKAELLRLWSRRLTWFLLLGVVVLAGAVTLAASWLVQPITAEEAAEAQSQFEEYQASWAQGGYCRDASQPCGEDPGLTLEHFLRTPVTYEEYVSGSLGSGVGALLAGVVLAAGLIGGEASSGSLGTQLTFTPRRGRLLSARTGAAVLGGVCLMAAFSVALFALETITFVMLRGPAELGMTDDLAWRFGRYLLAAVFLSLLAAGLTFALGGTGTAIGLGALVLVLSEFEAASLNAQSAREALWLRLLPSPNLSVLLEGTSPYSYWNEASARMEGTLSYGWSVGYAAVLVALVTVWGVIAFRRRDVLR